MAMTTRAMPGGDDGVDAGRRAAVVRARFERDEHRRAARRRSIAQRLDLRVRFAGAAMPSFGDDVAVAHDDAADHRIRADE